MNGFALSDIVAHQPLFGLALTMGAYEIGAALSRRLGWSLANPVLIAIIIVAPLLLVTGTSYDSSFESTKIIHLLLGPAAVALAVPLHANMTQVKRAGAAVVGGVIAGALTAAVSAVEIARVFGGSPLTQMSIAPKSTTMPIAIGISQQIGGAPELTAVLVLITGISGAILSTIVLDILGVRSWRVRGPATGVAAHGIGTARILALDETGGAFASLGMGLCGLATAILMPLAAHLLGLQAAP